MNGRSILGIALSVLIVIVLAGVGVGIYNAGVAEGIVEAGRVPAGAALPAGYGYGYGWHGAGIGFGFFGLLFPILFILLLVGIARAAFGGGRGRWGGGWGPGGPGAGPGGWQEERERRISELHQRLHDDEARRADPGRSGTA